MRKFAGLVLCVLMAVCVSDAFMFRSDGSSRNKRGGSAFTRTQAIECVLRCVDGLAKYKDRLGRDAYNWTTKDGCVNATEIQNAKDRYLSDAEKALTSIVKTNEQILWDCDYDTTARSVNDKAALQSGCISKQDMIDSVDTCIREQAQMDLLRDKICERCGRYVPLPPASNSTASQ